MLFYVSQRGGQPHSRQAARWWAGNSRQRVKRQRERLLKLWPASKRKRKEKKKLHLFELELRKLSRPKRLYGSSGEMAVWSGNSGKEN